MTQPLPWEKNAAVPVPPGPEPVPLDAYTAPAAPEPELVSLDIYDAPAPDVYKRQAQTKGIPVARVDIPAQLKGALFLVSDEHGVVPATETDAAEADAATVAFFAERCV